MQRLPGLRPLVSFWLKSVVTPSHRLLILHIYIYIYMYAYIEPRTPSFPEHAMARLSCALLWSWVVAAGATPVIDINLNAVPEARWGNVSKHFTKELRPMKLPKA